MLVAGAIAGGWLYRGVLASYFPTSETTELSNQIGALEANDKAMQDRLNAMVASIDAVNATAAMLDQQIKATQSAFAEANRQDRRLRLPNSAPAQRPSPP